MAGKAVLKSKWPKGKQAWKNIFCRFRFNKQN